MRTRFIMTALACIVIAAFSTAAFAQAKTEAKGSGKNPAVVMGEKTINLGEVLEGQDYQHSFVIKNGGPAELQILSVRPG